MNFNNQDSCVVIEFNAECEASIKDWLTARLKSAGLGTQVWTNSKDQVNKHLLFHNYLLYLIFDQKGKLLDS